MKLSLATLLWAHAAVMALQFGEKLVLGRGFGEVIRRRILSEYDRSLFVLQHVTWLLTITVLLALFELMGERWVVLVLSVGVLATTMSLAMLVASMVLREYVPGTVSGLGLIALQYMLLSQHLGSEMLDARLYVIAAIIGVSLAGWMIASVILLRRAPMDG